jgi:hypothetical protein
MDESRRTRCIEPEVYSEPWCLLELLEATHSTTAVAVKTPDCHQYDKDKLDDSASGIGLLD